MDKKVAVEERGSSPIHTTAPQMIIDVLSPRATITQDAQTTIK